MDPLLIKILIFGLGIIVQSIIILGINKNFLRNIKTTGLMMALACVLSFLVKLDNPEVPINTLIHYSFIIYSILFGLAFMGKILPVIQERTMLLFTILFWYGWIAHFESVAMIFNNQFLLIAIIPTLISVFASLSPYVLPKFIRIIQYMWYLVITLSFSFILMNGYFWETLKLNIPNGISNLDLFLSGYIGLFIVTNIFYLYFFIPIPCKHQSMKERMKILKEYLSLLIKKYNNNQLKPIYSLLYIAVFSLILYLNYQCMFLSTTAIIGSSVALITVIDKITNLEVEDERI